MNYRTRTYYTDRQKALMWERWKAAGLFTRLATCLIDHTRLSKTFCRGRVAFDRLSDAGPWWHCRWARGRKSRARW